MSPNKDDSGRDTQETSSVDVPAVFDEVGVATSTTTAVIDVLGCSLAVARDRLKALHEQGSVDRRTSGWTVLWWRTDAMPSWKETFGALADTDVPEGMEDQRAQLREEWADR
ncbi:hypothetical protein [Haloarchaeobius sp. HRN-SO-5]|uniref:hypothetical protein n=1 Tax=Haloarchaeobius sp. HRN-SO-5 TaxID=3446118 RepID=UPI003EBC20C6